jgi:hypothetical protein
MCLEIHPHHSTLMKCFPYVSYVIIATTYTKIGHKLGNLDSRDINPVSLPESQRLYERNSIILSLILIYSSMYIEYQKCFLGVKAAGAYGSQIYQLHAPIVLTH